MEKEWSSEKHSSTYTLGYNLSDPFRVLDWKSGGGARSRTHRNPSRTKRTPHCSELPPIHSHRGGGKRVSLCHSFPWWSYKHRFSYHNADPICFTWHWEHSILAAKLLSCNNQHGSGPPLPLLFPRTILSHPLHICVPGSLSLPNSTRTVSITAASENFSQAPS